MVWLLSMTLVLTFLTLYCLGGQTWLWTRRFLLPSLVALLTLGITFVVGSNPVVAIIPLIWIGAFSIGDGEKSVLKKWLGTDLLVRVVYGLICSIPILLGVIWYHNQWWQLGASVAICGAFVPDFGAWITIQTPIGPKSLLGSDVLRGLAMATCWLMVILTR